MNASKLKNLIVAACVRWRAMADDAGTDRAVNALGAAIDAVDAFKDSFSLLPDSVAERLRKAEETLLDRQFTFTDGAWRRDPKIEHTKTTAACAQMREMGFKYSSLQQKWISSGGQTADASTLERLRKAESKLLQEQYLLDSDGQWRPNLAEMNSKTSSACARLYSLGYSWDHVKREWLSRQVANGGKTPIYEFCENRPNEHCPWHQSDAIEHAHMRALPNFFRTRVRYE